MTETETACSCDSQPLDGTQSPAYTVPTAFDGYYDLGTHTWPISTQSPDAQRWFDRGLMWMYAFNHEEAGRCFEKAADSDPDCAMAYWGIAYVIGPNYNKPWGKFDRIDLAHSLRVAVHAAARARQAAALPHTSAIERAVIDAMVARYPSPQVPDDFTAWNVAYASAMGRVYDEFGESVEVATLYADAAMNVNPRQFWKDPITQPHGAVPGARIKAVLEKALAQSEGWRHPGTLHLYVHVMEGSEFPERGLNAADRLRGLVPAAGHLHHMPTHLDALAGDYARVVESNSVAVIADRDYVRREGGMSFYTLYRVHNLHFKIYGAMMMGLSSVALQAAEEMADALPAELLRVQVPPMADWVEGSVGMRLHVLIRFGRWREIIDTPLPDDRELYSVTTAMTLYAKGIAYSAMNQIDEAEKARAEFREAAKLVPPTRDVFDTLCVDLMGIADAMLNGELAYRKGNFDEAFSELRRAVDLNDALPAEEPWGQMLPPRHALGALLLEQGHYAEAEEVYRTDLGLNGSIGRMYRRPNNVWSLHGLHECLIARGETSEAQTIGQQLTLAVARADVPIQASCCCRLSAMTGGQ